MLYDVRLLIFDEENELYEVWEWGYITSRSFGMRIAHMLEQGYISGHFEVKIGKENW